MNTNTHTHTQSMSNTTTKMANNLIEVGKNNTIINNNNFVLLNEEYANKIKFIGDHCGQYGDYTFYKAISFVHPADNVERILLTGEFFYLQMSNRREKFIAIGEMQLLWQSSEAQTPICLLRVFLEPERVNRSDCGEVSLSFSFFICVLFINLLVNFNRYEEKRASEWKIAIL